MKTKMIFAALAVLVMAGCSNETDEQIVNNGRTSLQVKGGVEMQMTRAVNEQWEKNDAIGIYMVNAENAIVEGVENYKYVTTEGNGNFAASGETAYLPDDGSAVTVKAYYPQGHVSSNLYSIDLTNQSNPAGIDLMSAQCDNVTKELPAATLSFSHKLTKVILNITAEEGIDISGLTVKIGNQKPGVKYDILTGVLTTTEDAHTDISMKYNGTTAEAILAPNSDSNPATDRTLTFAIAGKEYTATIPANTTFEPGKRCRYQIKFKMGTGIEAHIEGAEINDWTDVPASGETEITIDATHAPQNLYVIGDGCNAGWDINEGIVLMLKGDGIYEGDVALKAGSIKIAQSKDKSYGDQFLYWYMPAGSDNAAFTPGTEMMIQEMQEGVADYKWIISAEQADEYRIVINVKEMKLTATIIVP